MSVDGGSSNDSCFQNCIDGSATKAPPLPKNKYQELLKQYAPVNTSTPQQPQQPILSSRRSKTNQIVLSKRRIGKGKYAVSDSENDDLSSPPALEKSKRSVATTESYRSGGKPSRSSSSSASSSSASSMSKPRRHHRSRHRHSEPGEAPLTPQPPQPPQEKPEMDDYELRAAIEETIKSMQIVPDHVLPIAVNEAFQNMKMNKQQKHNFPPIVKTTIERHMPPEEISKFYQQDNLLDDLQYTKIKGLLLNTTALATTALNSFHITSMGTKYLPEFMKEFVEEPTNRSTFDELGQYIRGSIFDSPVFNMGSSIVGVFRKSHEKEMEEKRPKPRMASIVEEPDDSDASFASDATPIAAMEATLNEFKKRNSSAIIDSMPSSLLKKKQIPLTQP